MVEARTHEPTLEHDVVQDTNTYLVRQIAARPPRRHLVEDFDFVQSTKRRQILVGLPSLEKAALKCWL
jgi:hypothetical protein